MTFTVLAAYLLFAAAIVIAGRVLFMLSCRTEVPGKVTSDDYPRDQLARDQNLGRYIDSLRRYPNQPASRNVSFNVEYSYCGRTYRNWVTKRLRVGTRPATSLSLWIDPKNPNNVTADGPASWSVVVLLLIMLGGMAAEGRNRSVNAITCIADRIVCHTHRNSIRPLGADAWKHKQAPTDSSGSF